MRVKSKTTKQQKKHPGRQPSLSISKVSINQEKRGRCGGGGRFRGVPGNHQNVDFPLQFLAFLTSWGSPPDPGWWAAEDVESIHTRLAPPDDRRKQAFFENVALAAGILNIFASQTREIHALLTRAIAFWETAYRRIAGMAGWQNAFMVT